MKNYRLLRMMSFLKHGIVELFEQIMSTSRKKQYQLMTEHGIVEKEDFTEVDSLDFSNARIVFQGVEGCILTACHEDILWREL